MKIGKNTFEVLRLLCQYKIVKGTTLRKKLYDVGCGIELSNIIRQLQTWGFPIRKVRIKRGVDVYYLDQKGSK